MKILEKVISGLYTAYYNFRIFPIRVAIQLPLLVHHKTRITACKNSIIINGDVQRFMLKFGFGGSEGVIEKSCSYLSIKQGGKLKIKGRILIASGCSIRIEKNAQLLLGANFYMNKNGFIYCSKKIIIGDNVLIGWNVDIRDNDGHSVFYNDGTGNKTREISIGNHVWIASHSFILKSSLADDIIVASNSLVCKSIEDVSVLIGGHPAKILRHNVHWKL